MTRSNSRRTIVPAGAAAVLLALSACNGGTPGAGGSIEPPAIPLAQDRAAPASSAVDGQIAFQQIPPGVTNGLTDVYAMNPDGTHIRRLTHDADRGNSVFWTHWSPNGKQVLFARCLRGSCVLGTAQNSELGIVNADGTGERTISNFKSIQNESFSPDGNYIVFAHCNVSFADGTDGCIIARIKADGTGYTQLTSENPLGNTADLDPAYSPDGRSIVFDGLGRGGYLERLYIMNADGSNMRPLSDPALGSSNADVSPDGSRIAFTTYAHFAGFGANEEIWFGAMSGSALNNLVQVTHNNDDYQLPYLQAYHDFSPAWSPRGDAIVFERDNGNFTQYSLQLARPESGGASETLFAAVRPAAPSAARRSAGFARIFGVRNAVRLLETGGLTPSWGTAPPIH